MVRATETQLEEHLIRITDEVAVGKNKSSMMSQIGSADPPVRSGPLSQAVLGSCGLGAEIYVSHIDIFWIYVTKTVRQTKGSYRNGPFPVRGVLDGPIGPFRS